MAEVDVTEERTINASVSMCIHRNKALTYSTRTVHTCTCIFVHVYLYMYIPAR